MTDKTVSSLTAATALDGTELYYGVQSGADAKVTGSQIKTLCSASPTFAAGTASLPAFALSSGTNLTSATAGAVEYDGVVPYITPVASERGVITSEQFIQNSGTYTLVSQTAAQKLFNSPTNGQVTVGGNRLYHFECEFDLSSMSASSGAFGFALAGTATFTSLKWWSTANKAALATAASAQSTMNTTASNTAIATATTNTVAWATIEGVMRVNAGGTIIPQVSLGIAAAAVVGVNSFFRLWPKGNGSVVSVGNWS